MISWLPELFPVNPWTSETYDLLYEYFCKYIRDSNLILICYPIWLYREIEDGKEKIFWHLTSRENKPKRIPRRKKKFFDNNQVEKERLPDLRRSERITWIPAIISNVYSTEVLLWDYLEGNGTINTYLWLKREDFVVILKKIMKNMTYRLITSFYIDKAYKRKDFERKYDDRIK